MFHREGVEVALATFLAFAGAFATGCAEDGEAPSAAIVYDSAGVDIVFSPSPSWLDGPEWRVSTTPRLELKTDPSDSSTVLHRVVGVSVLPDGRVAVANMGDNTVRLYDAAGRLVWRSGGSGQGPREFREVRGLVLRDNRLWVLQPLPLATKVLDLDGAFVGTVTPPPVEGLIGPGVEGVLADGSVVMTDRPLGSGHGSVWTEYSRMLVIRGDDVDTIAELPSRRRVEIPGVGSETQALGPFLQVAAGDSAIFAGFPDSWEIGVWSGRGELVMRIRRAWQPEEVSSGDREAYGQAILQQGEQDSRVSEAYHRLADGMTYPEYHPAFSRFLIDRKGVLWVEEPQTDPPWSEAVEYVPVPPRESTWDLIDPSGVWIGTIALPARFRAMDIGADYVAGVAKDSLDVECVQVWDLARR